jgi:hypothetical protein
VWLWNGLVWVWEIEVGFGWEELVVQNLGFVGRRSRYGSIRRGEVGDAGGGGGGTGVEGVLGRLPDVAAWEFGYVLAPMFTLRTPYRRMIYS